MGCVVCDCSARMMDSYDTNQWETQALLYTNCKNETCQCPACTPQAKGSGKVNSLFLVHHITRYTKTSSSFEWVYSCAWYLIEIIHTRSFNI